MGRKIWRLPSPPTPLQNTTESPTSPTSPLSPPSTAPSSSHANMTNTTETKTTAQNLTPPPRLHLRTLIPSSSYLTPAPIATAATPPTPYPWIWKCHLCNSIYRLGVTRRCLEDGHSFCAVVGPPASPISPPPSSSSSGEEKGGSNGAKQALKKAKAKAKRKRDRKRAATRGCRAEFDYGGWSAYNAWRREVWSLQVELEVERGREGVVTRSRTRGVRDASTEDGRGSGRVWCPELYLENEDGDLADVGPRAEDRESDQTVDRGRSRNRDDRSENWRWHSGPGDRKNCWLGCDFPSQCHNEWKAEREWEARIKEMRRWDEEWWEREKVLGIALGEEDLAVGEGEDESMSVDVDVDRDRGGNEKRRKSTGDIGELGEESEVFMAGVGQWDEDEDGDTVMNDADMDFESEGDADAWAGFNPISGEKIGSYSQTHDTPIGLAITTNAATYPSGAGERDINFTAGISQGESQNLGPLGIDCDGLGEAGYQLTYTRSIRRKSIEEILGESPSSSPLKECSFGFEDLVGVSLACRRRQT
ncbi:hypothetical protein DL98DRAFT_571480 [Cadophora sp. DSE1049]|nr:hypothetical protein DL98DRAFT_571480 [Cadophora sp. DSE1049]